MAKPPPTRPSIKLEKTFTYRGTTQPWSNRYFFAPASDWTDSTFATIYAWLEAAEKLCLPSTVNYVEAVGYNAGSEVPVKSATLSGTGSAGGTGGTLAPGDAAAVIRFSTDQRSVKNHPIYLFKYFHGVMFDTAGSHDDLQPLMKTNLQTLIATLLAGHNDGTQVRQLCGPRGAVAQAGIVLNHVRHRDFV
jgi:hypothetical protein